MLQLDPKTGIAENVESEMDEVTRENEDLRERLTRIQNELAEQRKQLDAAAQTLNALKETIVRLSMHVVGLK